MGEGERTGSGLESWLCHFPGKLGKSLHLPDPQFSPMNMKGNNSQEYHEDEKGQRDGNPLCKLKCRTLGRSGCPCYGLNGQTRWIRFPVTGNVSDEKSPRKEARGLSGHVFLRP